MTSILAAAAPVLLALVPCLFAHDTPPHSKIVKHEKRSKPSVEMDAADAWWKPHTLGIDNYS